MDPPGFSPIYGTQNVKGSNKSSKTQAQREMQQQAELRYKKAMDYAKSPLKSIPMNALMMWMAGSGVQIFSIMITVMMFWNPVKSIMNTTKAFTSYVSPAGHPPLDLTVPKLTFIALNVISMAMGLYKLQTMGLLPTAKSDWLAWVKGKDVSFPCFINFKTWYLSKF
ncbi:hypothetical protein BKA69DRAFT_1061755 [Paraphysoderma sedebokerense]|nr:hypothetical protein BKA69DRAFT_1061755 [Paraphysoderma sedebokerense]